MITEDWQDLLDEGDLLPVDCVVPAAGCSSRMGEFKLLLPYRGRHLVTHAVRRALAVCRRVIVVTGHRADEVEALLQRHPRITVVRNDGYRDGGMISSIATGAGVVASPWFFVAPGDMPELPEPVFRRLAEAAAGDVGPGSGARTVGGSGSAAGERGGALFPVVGGRRGHPALIARTVLDELHRRIGDVSSMREFLDDFPTREIDVSDLVGLDEAGGIFYDIDTRSDL
ncbi:MAG: nucleotidyltransferase family protein [Alkalispirochaeta sp.]